jgi:hypothetical protein
MLASINSFELVLMLVNRLLQWFVFCDTSPVKSINNFHRPGTCAGIVCIKLSFDSMRL